MSSIGYEDCPFCDPPPLTFPSLHEVKLDLSTDIKYDQNLAKEFPQFSEALKTGALVCFKATKEKSYYRGDSGGPSFISKTQMPLMVVGVHVTVLADEKGRITHACDVAVAGFYDWITAQ